MPRTMRQLSIMMLGPLTLIVIALSYYFANRNYISTDNAYVQQDKVSVSTEVGGRVVEVRVKENQRVEAGDLLLRIDPEPFELAVAEAEVAIATAQARLEKLETDYATSNVDIERAEEEIAYYEREYRRQLDLQKTGGTTEAALRAAEHELALAHSRLAEARADAAKARAELSTGGSDSDVNPAVRAAQVQLAKANLNLSRTEIRSPVSGIVSQVDRLQIGQLMVQGLPVVSIVKTDRSWIEANFKETDLEAMRHGQVATIEIDAYADMQLQGKVESIGAGTGSEFSILPAQNATGNWVKVTQRVPVRITLETLPQRPLIAGLSASVQVDTSR